MRQSVLLLGTLAIAACVTESQKARPPEPPRAAAPDRSQETLREIDRQRRWAADALAARPAADELDAVRDGDREAISDTRKRFRRLLTAVERTTWIRETVPEVLRGSPSTDRLSPVWVNSGSRAAGGPVVYRPTAPILDPGYRVSVRQIYDERPVRQLTAVRPR